MTAAPRPARSAFIRGLLAAIAGGFTVPPGQVAAMQPLPRAARPTRRGTRLCATQPKRDQARAKQARKAQRRARRVNRLRAAQ